MPAPWNQDLPFPSMFGNNGNMLRAEMRITEVVHRYGDDRTTVLHMGNMERSLMVLADDRTGFDYHLMIGQVVLLSLDFDQNRELNGCACSAHEVEVQYDDFTVFNIPASELTRAGQLAQQHIHEIVRRISSAPLKHMLNRVLGDPAVYPGYFSMPVMKHSPSHYGIPGGMALRNSMAAHEIALQIAGKGAKEKLEGEAAIAAALLEDVSMARHDIAALDLMLREMMRLRQAAPEAAAMLTRQMYDLEQASPTHERQFCAFEAAFKTS